MQSSIQLNYEFRIINNYYYELRELESTVTKTFVKTALEQLLQEIISGDNSVPVKNLLLVLNEK